MTATVVLGELPHEVSAWLKQRRALGQDGHDEVWEGKYYVAPTLHGEIDWPPA